MIILGRKVSITRIPKVVIDLFQMMWQVRLFSNPIELLSVYFSQTSPKDNHFKLRSGHVIKLSTNAHDCITVMVIFCRREYGRIAKNSVVIDIGANIGVFSLYAALNGAKKVYAYEPNPEAYKSLVENIRINQLEHIIIPFNVGVSGTDNETIFIKTQSSPYNRIEYVASENTIEVNTISLKSIIDSVGHEKIDLCKIDCEGAEYEVLFNTPKELFSKIENVRMEHHDMSRKENLLSWFSSLNYKLIHDRYSILWFEKRKN